MRENSLIIRIKKCSTWLGVLLRVTLFNIRVSKDINLYIKRWNSIDHRRDKSLSSRDFRLWYFNRKMDEWAGRSATTDPQPKNGGWYFHPLNKTWHRFWKGGGKNDR